MEEDGSIACCCSNAVLVDVVANDFEINVQNSQVCVHTRTFRRTFVPNLDLPPLYAHFGCIRNEYTALVDRHLVPFNETSPGHVKKYDIILRDLSDKVGPVEKLTTSELIKTRPQRMRKRYSRGLLLDFKPVHATVNLFVKLEKGDDPTKAPRAIQFRSTPYAARLAKYTIPIEKLLYKPNPLINHGLTWVAKGLNAKERADVLWEGWQLFENPVAYLIDHSKFDSKVNPQLLKLEHDFYKRANPSREFAYLLKFQEKNKGRSRNGLRYKCTARRMSGDPNTALGNCIINYVILRAEFGSDAFIFLDGDDSVVVVDGHRNVDFSESGMVSKVSSVQSFSDIEFCQSKPVMSTEGWIMCREPIRGLNRACYSFGKWPINWRDYLATIGIGEGLVSPEMPILSVLAKKMRSYGGAWKWYFSDYRLGTMRCASTFKLPTNVSRISFAETFDIDARMQCLIEAELANMVLFNLQH